MNTEAIRKMGAAPGGTAEQPQATAVEATGDLVNGTVWPRPVSEFEWHAIRAAVTILTNALAGRVETHLYEVSRDDVGCIHIIIGRPQGT